VEIVYSEDINHYAYVVAFLCIVLGLLWGRFKAMHVFAAPVLLLILSGFMGIKHIYATAVNPSILTVMALIALTGVLKKHYPSTKLSTSSGIAPRAY